MTLSAAEFPAFYHAVNGFKPFPWQKRLVEEVIAHSGLWPSVLDLPTSAGKTSALDAAVFLLALQAGVSVHERKAALRTFFVVDRRIVVDEAADKARKLARLLNVADDKPDAPTRLQVIAREQRRVEPKQPDPLTPNDIALLQAVAARLRQFGGEKALHVSVLRGGMYRDGSWAESPTQPTICLSTVDQVGSRLLFRGYGVSPYQRAVHAGLVGNDALILVDEAHLSRPFLETLKAVEFYRSDRWAERPVTTPFQVVVMSATAGNAVEPVVKPPNWKVEPFKLDDANDKNQSVCPALHRRLSAKKLAKLVETTNAAFVSTLVEQALAVTESDKDFKPVRVIGVVVNRVRTARQVAELLRAEYRKQNPLSGGESDRPDVVLLTGRIRPYDRDELLFRRPIHDIRNPEVPIRGLLPFVKASANKEQSDYDRPPPPRGVLFVVATQTVEVGADFSLDALVTELAPLDALRQRFGRVDRLGFRERSRIVVVRNKEADKDDPVYGTAPTAVWKVLKEWEKASKKAKEIDFGIEATESRLPPDSDERATFLAPLCAPSACAPVMMPAHIDDWVQTSVAPEPDPDPALFLHGPQSGPADVSVVWRADISEELLVRDLGKRDGAISGQVVALVPPTSMEALSLPIWHVRNWLRDRANARADFTDLEGEPESDAGRPREHPPSAPFLIWKGPDRPHRTTDARRKDRDRTRASDDPEDIRPGNTIMVPASYGRCDEFGWNPEHSAAVCDVADDCSWRAKRRPVLRVHPTSGVHLQSLTVWQRFRDPFPAAVIERLPSLLVTDPDTGEINWNEVAREFREVRGDFDWLQTARRVEYPSGAGLVLIGRKREPHPEDPNGTDADDEAPADDEGNSFPGDRIPLKRHCEKVRERADRFAGHLDLRAELRQILSRSALLHDAGKVDPRFQVWLFGNEAEAATHADNPIAKSSLDGQNASAIEAARKRAGWPKGGRHEAASVLLARSNTDAFAALNDPDLCEYLIGSHHGRGRPLWPFTESDEPLEPPGIVSVELDGFALSVDLPTRPEAALSPLHTGWVDLFWRLVRRYGYWGLAYLETLLVLADHRQSEAEREEQA